MAGQIELHIGLNKVSVFYYIGDGGEAPCHYCGKPGYQQVVEIDTMFGEAHLVPRKSKIWQLAKEKTEEKLFHRKRAICPGFGRDISPCRKFYNKDIGGI